MNFENLKKKTGTSKCGPPNIEPVIGAIAFLRHEEKKSVHMVKQSLILVHENWHTFIIRAVF